MPAFTQTRLFIDVPVSAEKVDPKSPASGDFDAVVRDALRALFPNVTSRADRKALSDVLSSGAADNVRKMVLADPSLIGRTIKAPVLLSSDADLYLKGLVTGREITPGAGIASPSATTGSIVISSTSNTFADQLLEVKQAMARHGADLRRESDRLALNLKSVEADLAASEAQLEKAKSVSDGPLIGRLETTIADLKDTQSRLAQKLADDRATADELTKRYERTGSAEALDSKSPTRPRRDQRRRRQGHQHRLRPHRRRRSGAALLDRRRACRQVGEDPARQAGGQPQDPGPSGRVPREAPGARRGPVGPELLLLHQRRQPRARARRNSGRARRLRLHDAGHARALPAASASAPRSTSRSLRRRTASPS